MITTKHTVELYDGTVGTIYENFDGPYLSLGQEVEVTLQDENGKPIKKTGKINCFLADDNYGI